LTERRRNLFILLLVGALLAASLFVITDKKTTLGLDLRGGVELVYEATPTNNGSDSSGNAATPNGSTPDDQSIDRAIEVMRDRVDQLGVAEPEIQRSGENLINVGLPDVKDADEAQKQVGQVAQLFFYDWEPNVIGPDGKPAPTNQNVTGGTQAGNPGNWTMTKYEAVDVASKRPPIKDGNNTHTGQWFAVNKEAKAVLAGPADSRAELEEDLDAMRKDDATGKRLREQAGGVTIAQLEDPDIVKVNEGTVIIRAEQPDDAPDDEKGDEWYVLADNVALRGTDIKNPEQNFNQGPGGNGTPNVTFDFTKKGRNIWKDTTENIAQRGQSQQLPGTPAQAAAQHFAIVLDDEIISAPFIDFVENPNGIDGANGSQIEGGFTIQSAQELANLLKTGALPVKLELISQSQVSATLGEQALDEGIVAGAAGFLIVALFLLIFYRLLGVIAVLALIVYSLFFFALVKLIPITLTLPGIAGTILTIGVAADANIVIFERVKEEIRGGRSVMAGLAAGYKKGLGAIIDANVVTILVAFILFVLATAGVKGFAFTLGVGTIVSLFTAVLFTQAIVGTLGRSRMLARPSALGAGKKRKPITFDFIGWSKWFFVMSGVILLVCAMALGGKGIDLGIDFESGTRIRTALERPADEGQIRSVLSRVGQADAEIQEVQEEGLGQNGIQISAETLRPNQVTQVTKALDDEFGVRGEPNTQSIGPTFGETVAKNAIIAIIVSLIVISVYLSLRFGWRYSAPVLIALFHDLLITAGVYALADREVTTSTVAALLTILGFSLYDTIIVFDRIRENVPRMPRAAFSQIVNRSMSEVVVRSLATTFTATLPVLMLLLFGGETLQDFAFALLVGTISGTYSSLFIASQVLTHWKEREPAYRRRRAAIAKENNGIVPAYATAAHAVEVDDNGPKRPSRRITAPEDPAAGVSREEFDEMVRDLHVDPPPTSTAVREPDPTADASPDDVFMKGDGNGKRRNKERKPRNKRHGRPR
jgi:SecD/SecF fusion protein